VAVHPGIVPKPGRRGGSGSEALHFRYNLRKLSVGWVAPPSRSDSTAVARAEVPPRRSRGVAGPLIAGCPVARTPTAGRLTALAWVPIFAEPETRPGRRGACRRGERGAQDTDRFVRFLKQERRRRRPRDRSCEDPDGTRVARNAPSAWDTDSAQVYIFAQVS